uniref:Ribosomal protein L6 n=1 Tax=Neogoniolithon spectabile TaxID=231755 RepID=A0A3G3MGS8_9FLOR|nr:ribosomal protein L6 [Neogoniolithon spectabile]AYR06023.1 ribosomal protein L6 [Neogoniolithon spectabile]
MSRIGRTQIKVHKGTVISINKQLITVKGPKGNLNYTLPKQITIEENNNFLGLHTINNDKYSKQLHGLCRTIVNNMIIGVTKGFKKKLTINGVGYRAQIIDTNELVLNLGYSHPIHIKPPGDINIKVIDNNIIVNGISKEKVGQIAAKIRSMRPPEPYKGKGIKYENEIIRKKVGKAGK